jgi:hypothetical protein
MGSHSDAGEITAIGPGAALLQRGWGNIVR